MTEIVTPLVIVVASVGGCYMLVKCFYLDDNANSTSDENTPSPPDPSQAAQNAQLKHTNPHILDHSTDVDQILAHQEGKQEVFVPANTSMSVEEHQNIPPPSYEQV